MAGSELVAWCPACRKQVALVNLRSWPEGVLAIGDCPTCHASVATSRPVGWSGESDNGNAKRSTNGSGITRVAVQAE